MVEEEGALPSPACPEGEAAYRQVRLEGAPGLADQQEKELPMTARCLRPRCALREEEGAEALEVEV